MHTGRRVRERQAGATPISGGRGHAPELECAPPSFVLVDESTAIAKYADPETTAIFIVGWSEVIRTALPKQCAGPAEIFTQRRGKAGGTKEALEIDIIGAG
jgi:hypothetical protein